MALVIVLHQSHGQNGQKFHVIFLHALLHAACISLFMPDIRAVSWIGTSYREAFKLPLGIKYGVYQLEMCPKTGRRHAQFFVQFKQRKRFTAVQKLFPGDHIEIAHDPAASREYCMKESTRVAKGEEIGVWEGVEDVPVARLLKKKRVVEVLEERPTLWRSVSQLMQVRSLMSSPREKLTEGILLNGRTGTGKTRTASLIASYLGDAYWQDGSQWWNNYDGQKLVVIDEYRGQFPISFFLRLLDRTPFQVPSKGGYVNFNSEVIIFCSNLSFDALFKDLDSLSRDAARRRFKVIKEFW